MNNDLCIDNGTVLVTGGLGAIGIALIKILIDSGRDVVVYDWKRCNNSTMLAPGVKVVNGDIRDEERFSKLLSEEHITGIVHLAAISQVGVSERNHTVCSSVNIGGMLSLVRAIDKSGSMPWVVNCSSREVYGEPSSIPVHESHPLRPINTYGMTKVVAEKMLEYNTQILGLNAITLRPTNVYGSIHDPPERVVPRFIVNALAGKPIEVYGGDQVLDLMHISDAIDGIVRAISLLERLACHEYYDVFNLATGVPHSLNDVISLISQNTGITIDTTRSESRSFDVKRYVGDTKKARESLGFEAKMMLEEGIPATIEDYKACVFNTDSKNRIKEVSEGLAYREAMN